MSNNGGTPAGWYPDPKHEAPMRYWDGTGWTAHTHGEQPTAPAPAAVALPSLAEPKQKLGLIGGRKQLEEENELLRSQLASLGVAERDQLRQESARLGEEVERLRRERDEVAREVVVTREAAILQEVGVYEYRHPLDDATAHKRRRDETRERIAALVKRGHAVQGATAWTVNNSAKEGVKMVADLRKLMLRAYNNEVDNLVRSLKPHAVPRAIERLTKTRATIERLGATMHIKVSEEYHRLRVYELELTGDYLAKVAEQKELERAERERLRDEEKAQRDFERENARLLKEESHYESAVLAMRAAGDEQAALDAEAKLEAIREAKAGLAERAANIRAGYVYVISNVGSFGPRMVKVGMTRRLDPRERVTELGDASVPFRYDIHAIVFSDDAVSLENQLHRALGPQRVNLVNLRREFFYATPTEVKTVLAELSGSLLTFTEDSEALEWHQSENSRAGTSSS